MRGVLSALDWAATSPRTAAAQTPAGALMWRGRDHPTMNKMRWCGLRLFVGFFDDRRLIFICFFARDGPMAMDGRAAGKDIIVLCRAGRKPLRAGLSARALQFRDARRWPAPPRVQRCRGMETQPLNRPLRMTEPLALPREDASSGSRASRAGAEAA